MSTTEELQSMTHEDLVRRVQELCEANETLAREKAEWADYYTKLQARYDHFKNAIRSIVLITD